MRVSLWDASLAEQTGRPIVARSCVKIHAAIIDVFLTLPQSIHPPILANFYRHSRRLAKICGLFSRYNRRVKISYHRDITNAALASTFSPSALQVIVRANVEQDGLRYQFGHDHFHFDSNSFDAAYAYIEEQRVRIADALKRGNADTAWQAFGKLTHTVQDFYAHSNYIPLWLDSFNGAAPPPPPEVDPVSPQILQSPNLRSGKLYYPFEALTFIPRLGKLFIPLMPRDSHAHMNHDGPDDSPLFDYVFQAAVKRTRYEFGHTITNLSQPLITLFTNLT